MEGCMKKILSFLLLLSLCLAFPDSVMAKETTYDYETVIDMVAEEYIGKTIPGASIIISEHGDIVLRRGTVTQILNNKYRLNRALQFLSGDLLQKLSCG